MEKAWYVPRVVPVEAYKLTAETAAALVTAGVVHHSPVYDVYFVFETPPATRVIAWRQEMPCRRVTFTDWVVRHQDGKVEVMSDGQFRQTYREDKE